MAPPRESHLGLSLGQKLMIDKNFTFLQNRELNKFFKIFFLGKRINFFGGGESIKGWGIVLIVM